MENSRWGARKDTGVGRPGGGLHKTLITEKLEGLQLILSGERTPLEFRDVQPWSA